jgi:hypothetical protein
MVLPTPQPKNYPTLGDRSHSKFVVLRTYFTKSQKLEWINGLVCTLGGEFESSTGVFKNTGYELIL